MPNLTYNNENFEYELRRSRRKTIGITINPDGSVVVTAPLRLSQAKIMEALQHKAGWISKKLALVHDIAVRVPVRSYVSGEKFWYLGKGYPLNLTQTDEHISRIKYADELFYIDLQCGLTEEQREQCITELFQKWYKRAARIVIGKRMVYYAEILKVHPQGMKIKSQKSLWGSCTGKDIINFNWKLIMTPPEVIDYVVVHELCHLIERNHSSNFWNLVAGILPDYKQQKNWLKMNGATLVI